MASMYCQKCRTPLKADSLDHDLNPAAFDLLVGSAKKPQPQLPSSTPIAIPQDRRERYEQAIKNASVPLYRRTIPPARDPYMSFIDVTESQIVPNGQEHATQDRQSGKDKRKDTIKPSQDSDPEKPFSWHISRTNALNSILSAHSDIDHPICLECSHFLLSGLQSKLTTAQREKEAYTSFLKSLTISASKHSQSADSITRELAALKIEEEKAFAELLAAEADKKELEDELAELEEQSLLLKAEEDEFWRARNEMDAEVRELRIEVQGLEEKLGHEKRQLERLQRTNVYNDTFYISHDGRFGTINGLRLGKLPDVLVSWEEVNAAWGWALLLLQTIAERLGFGFRGFKLRPLGSTSRIERIESTDGGERVGQDEGGGSGKAKGNASLELHSSGEVALGRLLNYRGFDAAMVAFLECLRQLGDFVENGKGGDAGARRGPGSQAKTMQMPFAIEADKIWKRESPDEKVSIKLGVGFGVSQDEDFTKACKWVLTCCKYLLAHVSGLEGERKSSG